MDFWGILLVLKEVFGIFNLNSMFFFRRSFFFIYFLDNAKSINKYGIHPRIFFCGLQIKKLVTAYRTKLTLYVINVQSLFEFYNSNEL